ncbi:hypothetical protein ACD591_17510 [Rufibacter glacialis]|uniref:Uncharacterized protein n=1 Tax=Rufibacter glacialis TaxID=1259555 RepID=A0ABV4RIV3_9BACT|nr:hypothetical protein [Rufibacter glacialis]
METTALLQLLLQVTLFLSSFTGLLFGYVYLTSSQKNKGNSFLAPITPQLPL